MNLYDFLLEHRSDQPFLSTASDIYTDQELRCAVEFVFQKIQKESFPRQSRFLLIADNSFFWVVSYLAIIKAGHVVVPVAPDTDAPTLAFIQNQVEPEGVFFSDIYADHLQKYLGSFRISEKSLPDQNRLKSTDLSFSTSVEVDDKKDLASIMFTSGSTGKPKGVMVTHRNIMANTSDIIQALALTESDKVMVVLPFYYCFGTSLLHTHLRIGGELCLYEGLYSAPKILKAMQQFKVTGFAGVPSHYELLLMRMRSEVQLPALRFLQQAGGRLRPESLKKISEVFKHQQLYVMYGQTEATARISILAADDFKHRSESVGKPLPHSQVQIFDSRGKELASGQEGEVCITGDAVTLGYWQSKTEKNSTSLENKSFNGILRTGDLGFLDKDGYLYITGRKSRFIKLAGKRVSMAAIEDAYKASPVILDCAITKTNHPVMGEAVRAFLVIDPSYNRTQSLHDPSEVLAELENYIQREWLPYQLTLLNELPKTKSGKIDRQKLTSLDQEFKNVG